MLEAIDYNKGSSDLLRFIMNLGTYPSESGTFLTKESVKNLVLYGFKGKGLRKHTDKRSIVGLFNHQRPNEAQREQWNIPVKDALCLHNARCD